MKNTQKTKYIIAALFLLALATAGTVLGIKHYQDLSQPVAILPQAQPYTTANQQEMATTAQDKTKPSNTTPKNPTVGTKGVNLAIPFISQAPKKNWDASHEDFCEEASALMAQHYIRGTSIGSIDNQDTELFAIKDYEMKSFGYFESTDVNQTKQILTDYLHIPLVKIIENPSVEDIKKALASGKAVLLPAAGRLLGNPHFSGAGPLYHMLVIKGYTADGQFITNDPGTQFGKDYLYPTDRIMNAMHDWNGGKVMEGKKAIIVVG